MKRLLGIQKKKAPVEPPNFNTILSSIDSRAENADSKIAKCDAELINLRERLKGLREGPGKEALSERIRKLLQKRKTFETQADSLHQHSFNMEQTSFGLQEALNNKAFFESMKSGIGELKKVQKNLHVEEIEDLQDKMANLFETTEDLQNVLDRNFTTPLDLDDDQLAAELEALGDELVNDPDTSYLDTATGGHKGGSNNIGPGPALPKDLVEGSKDSPGTQIIENKNGILFDEFGLPKID